MTTITIKNVKNLSRTQFDDLADLQDYLISINLQDEFEISTEHQEILDKRLEESRKNPENFISFEQFKKNLNRKNV